MAGPSVPERERQRRPVAMALGPLRPQPETFGAASWTTKRRLLLAGDVEPRRMVPNGSVRAPHRRWLGSNPVPASPSRRSPTLADGPAKTPQTAFSCLVRALSLLFSASPRPSMGA